MRPLYKPHKPHKPPTSLWRRRALLGLVFLALGKGAARHAHAQESLPPPQEVNEPPQEINEPLQEVNEKNTTLKRIEEYLNGLTTMDARFIQSSSTGEWARGRMLFSRPGSFRIDYEPPATLLVVGAGGQVIFHDRAHSSVTAVPLVSTPLRFFLGKTIALHAELKPNITRTAGLIFLRLLEERSDEETITLVFSENPLRLRQWMIEDAQGGAVEVTLQDAQFGVSLDKKAFDISRYTSSSADEDRAREP